MDSESNLTEDLINSDTVEKSKRGRRRKDSEVKQEGIDNLSDLLNSVMAKVNEGIKNRRISKDTVYLFALGKLNDSDIQKIRRENISNEDRVMMLYEDFKKKTENHDINFYDFLALQMKLPN